MFAQVNLKGISVGGCQISVFRFERRLYSLPSESQLTPGATSNSAAKCILRTV